MFGIYDGELVNLVRLSRIDDQGNSLPSNECGVVVIFRIESVIAWEASLLTDLIAITSIEDINMFVRTCRRNKLDQLSWRRAESEQECNSPTFTSAIAQNLLLGQWRAIVSRVFAKTIASGRPFLPRRT